MCTEGKNEIIYLAAYTVIKKMLEEKVISKAAFERLNQKMAEKQNCKAVVA